jgi:hypothetical protein
LSGTGYLARKRGGTALTDRLILQNFNRQMALLRRHKALILAKNVLYNANHEG